MAIYSFNLGAITEDDTGIEHLLYSVPSVGGPAIVRSVSLTGTTAGQVLAVYAKDPAGDAFFVATWAPEGGSYQCSWQNGNQVIPAGWSLYAQNLGTSGGWTALVAGYQFQDP
jgi:hypothetical protein